MRPLTKHFLRASSFRFAFPPLLFWSLVASAGAADVSCQKGETLLWQCKGSGATDVLLCGGRVTSQFSAPYLELRSFRQGELIDVFPSSRKADLTLKTDLYASNYALVMKSGSEQMRIFESVRTDDDSVTFEDSTNPKASKDLYCQSIHDDLLEATAYGIEETRKAEKAADLAKASRAIGSLRPEGRARQLSNDIRLDEQNKLIVERTYVTSVPMGDGRTRDVYDDVTWVVDPHDVISFAVNYGSSAHLLEGEDEGYCSVVSLQLDVRTAPESSDTKPVSFYACADKTAEMRGVVEHLMDLFFSLSAHRGLAWPNGLHKDEAWVAPPESMQPYLAVIERHCVVDLDPDPFDQVCAEQVRPITDLSTGKDHLFQRVAVVDPNGTLDRVDWHVRVVMTDVEDPDSSEPTVFRVHGGAEPHAVAEQLLPTTQNEYPLVSAPSDGVDTLSSDVYWDRERLAYTIGYFPWVGIKARYELVVDRKARALGSVTVSYPGS